MASLPDSHLDLFESRAVGHFATQLPDGTPHVTPVWIDHEAGGDRVVVNTATGRRKTMNVRERPGVGLSVTDTENPYRWCSLTGTVAAIEREGAVEHIHELSRRYTGESYDLSADGGDRVRLVVDLSQVLTGG